MSTTSLSLPPASVLGEAAAELLDQATDRRTVNAINKALWNLLQGITITPTYGGFLVPSGTRGGVIHRVSNVDGCSCEAGQAEQPCWHAEALAIVEAAQARAVPVPITPRRAAYDQALAAINELYA